MWWHVSKTKAQHYLWSYSPHKDKKDAAIFSGLAGHSMTSCNTINTLSSALFTSSAALNSRPRLLKSKSCHPDSCKCKQVVVHSSLQQAATGLFAAVVLFSASAPDAADTLSDVPQTLSGECLMPQDCNKGKIQRPKSRQAESCTIKCVTTCIRGGGGSPGEGPLNVRRYDLLKTELVISFKYF